MFDLVTAILAISHAFSVSVSCLGSPPTNGHSMAGASSGLVINTTSGMVQGYRRQIPDGPAIRTWQGIPYAQAPVAKLRFRPPESVKRWMDIKDTLSPPPACPQSTASPITAVNITKMDEDCLFLNIFSPEHNSDNLHPVMIWIHSGGFNTGSSMAVDPTRLTSEEQVVVVTLQYRLGALGFLYLGNEGFQQSSAPYSNLGLRDQVAGIEWISQNIMAFGGDPTRVTLFGSEAGAVASSYHLQNVHVSNLIQGVILQSGGPINKWAKKDPNTMTIMSVKLAKKVGCPTQWHSLVTECLENVEVSEILAAQNNVCDNSLEGNCFVPIVDEETVFSNDYVRNLTNTNKAILKGYNSNEGFLKLMKFLTKEFPTEKLHSEGFSREMFVKMVARMFPNAAPQTHAIIDFLYADDVEDSPRASVRFLSLEKIVADYMYNCGQEFIPKSLFNEHQSSLESKQQIFKYKFSWSPSKDNWPRWSGVKQGDEVQFIFGEPLNHPEDYLIEEKELSRKVMAHWANFANTGSPNNEEYEWPEYSPDGHLVMDLNAIGSKVTQIQPSQIQRCKFWNNFMGKLQEIKPVECKTKIRSKGKKKDFSQKLAEINTNEIERISPSFSKSSQLMVDEPHSTTRRTMRGLNFKMPKGRQFIYKVKTQIPKDEEVWSTVKVLEKVRPQIKKLFKRQLKPKNNTQISYKLNVDLENNSASKEPWAVYDTKDLGNSPIYIAPNKYQVDNQNPILNDDNLEDYKELTRDSFDNERERGSFNTYNKKTDLAPFIDENTRSRTSYDPFYPNFAGFGGKKANSRSDEDASVVLLEADSRPYFPNYFPKKDSTI